MANENDIRIGVSVVSDDAGTAKARQQLIAVQKEIENLKGAFSRGDKSAEEFNKELVALEKNQKSLRGAINAVTGEYTQEANAMRAATVEAKRLATEQERAAATKPTGAGAGLRLAGRELRNLPSTQIPGLGIGTDAVGNIVRVSGAIVDVGEKSKVAAAAASVLTTASNALSLGLGAQTIATYAAYAPIALLVGGIATIGIALTKLTQDTSSNAESINAYAENQRRLNEEIADGLTSEEAREELDRLTEAQTRNKGTLSELQGGYRSAERQLGVLSGVVKVFSGDEEALAGQINETTKTIKEQQYEIDALSGALNNGALATNNAAAAAERNEKALEELNREQDDYVQKLQASEQSIQNYNDQIDRLNQSFEKQSARAAATEMTNLIGGIAESVIANNEKIKDRNYEAEKRLDAHNARLKDIETNANQEVEQLRAQSAQKAVDTTNEIAQIQRDFEKSEAAARERFNDQQLEREIQFRQRQADIDRDFKQARENAALNNDVFAFLQAEQDKKDSERSLKRDQRENEREVKRFERERQSEAAALKEKIDGINAELTAFQTAQDTKIKAELDAITTRQAAEEQAFKDSESALIARQKVLDQREIDREDRRDARQQRRDETLENYREADHQEQIKMIEATRDKEIERFEALTGELDKVEGSIARIGIGTEALAFASERIASAALVANPFLNATGSVGGYNSEGTGWHKVPDTTSPSLPPPIVSNPGGTGGGFNTPASFSRNGAMSSGGSSPVNLTFVLGDIATMTQVKSTLDEWGVTYSEAQAQAITSARRGGLQLG